MELSNPDIGKTKVIPVLANKEEYQFVKKNKNNLLLLVPDVNNTWISRDFNARKFLYSSDKDGYLLFVKVTKLIDYYVIHEVTER